jgi:hypothetical protein
MSQMKESYMWKKAWKALGKLKDWYVFDPKKDEPIKWQKPMTYDAIRRKKGNNRRAV